MITTIPRRKCRRLYPKLPISKYHGNQFIYPKIYKLYVLTLPSKSARGHAKNIALCLQKLLKGMGIDKLIFMGDIDAPWLYRNSDYKPAKEGVDYLTGIGLSKIFSGGLVVSLQDVYPFFQHLYWLIRTNTISWYVHGIDEKQSIIVNVCQHGGVHIDTLDEETNKLFNKSLPASGFIFRQENTCFDPWQKTVKIKGRSLIV